MLMVIYSTTLKTCTHTCIHISYIYSASRFMHLLAAFSGHLFCICLHFCSHASAVAISEPCQWLVLLKNVKFGFPLTKTISTINKCKSCCKWKINRNETTKYTPTWEVRGNRALICAAIVNFSSGFMQIKFVFTIRNEQTLIIQCNWLRFSGLLISISRVSWFYYHFDERKSISIF